MGYLSVGKEDDAKGPVCHISLDRFAQTALAKRIEAGWHNLFHNHKSPTGDSQRELKPSVAIGVMAPDDNGCARQPSQNTERLDNAGGSASPRILHWYGVDRNLFRSENSPHGLRECHPGHYSRGSTGGVENPEKVDFRASKTRTVHTEHQIPSNARWKRTKGVTFFWSDRCGRLFRLSRFDVCHHVAGQISCWEDQSLGARLGVTCNTIASGP